MSDGMAAVLAGLVESGDAATVTYADWARADVRALVLPYVEARVPYGEHYARLAVDAYEADLDLPRGEAGDRIRRVIIATLKDCLGVTPMAETTPESASDGAAKVPFPVPAGVAESLTAPLLAPTGPWYAVGRLDVDDCLELHPGDATDRGMADATAAVLNGRRGGGWVVYEVRVLP